ncbi:hypothetical protein [Devosia sp.]|uniref:hypothetical protein n=1 Tax=Devosia sp. TaxID=1871048 RepID=UPI002736B9E2|nr:hypothetical protein [Devosia sp.]MDP2780907.1 hypothetical protein [Devosia sp.]
MAGSKQRQQPVRQSGDVILFQKINGGWEYRYTSQGETFLGFSYDNQRAKARLLLQLGWERKRYERAQFRRF